MHRYRQTWHLPEDAAPIVQGDRTTTRRSGGNLVVLQLMGGATSIVRGSTDPIQGWISHQYGVRLKAPVIEVAKTGRTVHYLTLLAPTEGQGTVSVSGPSSTADGFCLTVTIDGHAEVVSVTPSGSSIVDAPDPPPITAAGGLATC